MSQALAAPSVASGISASAMQLINFTAKNCSAFCNSAVQYSKQVANTPIAQNVIAFVQTFFAKLANAMPRAFNVQWTPQNAAIITAGTLFIALFTIGTLSRTLSKEEV